ncbi:hypothetical protein CORC01_07219 [Colletotrichum orchidophilum]|uniref:Uncharacterized protein n=1 Tax=Colletotrichum orchidophilum TaxID=1209926 RepID=A0A1G4B7P3_9PEZI|nr:uncharacterized protein CORC01_07219 [Colletotrichum orchidophilum]OHE97437.1 hypothetical protein CORC01_07219 [Colletotrichum orchidophilum]
MGRFEKTEAFHFACRMDELQEEEATDKLELGRNRL